MFCCGCCQHHGNLPGLYYCMTSLVASVSSEYRSILGPSSKVTEIAAYAAGQTIDQRHRADTAAIFIYWQILIGWEKKIVPCYCPRNDAQGTGSDTIGKSQVTLYDFHPPQSGEVWGSDTRFLLHSTDRCVRADSVAWDKNLSYCGRGLSLVFHRSADSLQKSPAISVYVYCYKTIVCCGH
jgi:hypothetical protein